MVQNLEFFVPEPELSYLKVCPSVVCLPPRQGARVQVSFCPPKALPERGCRSGSLNNEAETDKHEEQDGDRHEAAAGGAAAPPGGLGGKDSNKRGEDRAKAAGATGPAAASSAFSTKNAVAPTASDAEAEQQSSQDKCDGIAVVEAEGADGKGQDENDLPLVPLYAGALDEGGLMDSEEGEAQEPLSRHGRWRVPCFLKCAGAHVFGGNSAQRPRGQGARGREVVLPPLALEVRVQCG